MGHHAPAGRRLSLSAPLAADLFPARDTEPDLIEAGRLLFARECRFVAGVATMPALMPETLPEVAFAGRSNVGKSSLVNALTGRRMLARTSNTPGRTRQINFFDLGGRLMLVDLPGHGYAEAAKSLIRSWTALIQRYVRARGTLRRVCLLVDARHGIKDVDRELMRLCDGAGLSYQIVLTKTDKLRPSESLPIAEAVATELRRHPAAFPEIHLTSAQTGAGIAALRAGLAALAEPAQARPERAAGPAFATAAGASPA
ncbi:MAG: YihA family ribosome biogenesis GTP-binding protein [Alphaproteobacteria bacterium]|nr:YihA family ribosome biogenesis GTP-binding protein [Alphaproteobacteria bacterium]